MDCRQRPPLHAQVQSADRSGMQSRHPAVDRMGSGMRSAESVYIAWAVAEPADCHSVKYPVLEEVETTIRFVYSGPTG